MEILFDLNFLVKKPNNGVIQEMYTFSGFGFKDVEVRPVGGKNLTYGGFTDPKGRPTLDPKSIVTHFETIGIYFNIWSELSELQNKFIHNGQLIDATGEIMFDTVKDTRAEVWHHLYSSAMAVYSHECNPDIFVGATSHIFNNEVYLYGFPGIDGWKGFPLVPEESDPLSGWKFYEKIFSDEFQMHGKTFRWSFDVSISLEDEITGRTIPEYNVNYRRELKTADWWIGNENGQNLRLSENNAETHDELLKNYTGFDGN